MSEQVADRTEPPGEVKVRKTRASKPKVKTGCQTCKIRRVKCDETKPNCMRCLKFGHQCDGYINKNALKSPAGSSSSRLLVPKTPPSGSSSTTSSQSQSRNLKSPGGSGTEATYSSQRSPNIQAATKLYPTPHRPLFQTPQEHHAFRTFCNTTSHQLSSSFSADLWTRLMLQACETSPSIRHAVIALGALNLTTPSHTENSVGTLRHQFAFRQYNKALCLLRLNVAGGLYDLRTTLIASLLFNCFESFQGYQDLAISQVYSGLKLIREWASGLCRTDPERRWIRSGSEDRNPQDVEDDILRAFGSLEIQVMLYADGRTREAHENYRMCGQSSINEMPVVFSSLEEAKALLEVIIRRSMHWLRSTMHLHTFGTSPSSPSPPSSPKSPDREGSPPSSTSPPISASQPSLFFDVDPKFSDRLTTLNEYTRWDTAFRPLLIHAHSRAASHSFFLLASTLRLHWLAGYMSIASNNSHSALVNNTRYTILLQELVGIARTLITEDEKKSRSASRNESPSDIEMDDGNGASTGPGDPNEEKGYVFDMQIIVPLMTVGWIYRHRALRRSAIELLLRSPRKEGVWDGIVIGKIMAWLAGIEEEVVSKGGPGWDDDDSESEGEDGDGEYVPEWAAARCIKMEFDAERREAIVSCLQPVRGRRSDWRSAEEDEYGEVRREVIIPW